MNNNKFAHTFFVRMAGVVIPLQLLLHLLLPLLDLLLPLLDLLLHLLMPLLMPLPPQAMQVEEVESRIDNLNYQSQSRKFLNAFCVNLDYPIFQFFIHYLF